MRGPHNRDYAKYTPTIEEIHRCLAVIREGWSEAEHHRRAGVSISPVEARLAAFLQGGDGRGED